MHDYFMLAALDQAWLGRGSCAPNPSVGAVIVHQTKVIAAAYHQGVGSAHAEQLALQQLPQGLSSLSLYVTLEPCNHWGRTPPCTSAIIAAGITRVVYGYRDPNPVVAVNDTPRLLQEKGIEVVYLPLKEIRAFYRSYQYWLLEKKPWITAKIAQSLDGKIAAMPGKPYPISNASCSEFTHQQRLYTDLILTTAKTIQADNPLFTARVAKGEKSKFLAIVDSKLALTSDAQALSHAKHCHIYYDESLKVENPLANCSYHPTPKKDKGLDLTFIINHLGKLGYHDVWVEAGGVFFSALHQEKLVQRTYLYIAAIVLGPNSSSAFHYPEIFDNKAAVTWQIKADNVIACVDWQEDECLPVS